MVWAWSFHTYYFNLGFFPYFNDFNFRRKIGRLNALCWGHRCSRTGSAEAGTAAGQRHRAGSLREESVKPLRGLVGAWPAVVSRQVDIVPLRSGCRPCPCRCWTGMVWSREWAAFPGHVHPVSEWLCLCIPSSVVFSWDWLDHWEICTHTLILRRRLAFKGTCTLKSLPIPSPTVRSASLWEPESLPVSQSARDVKRASVDRRPRLSALRVVVSAAPRKHVRRAVEREKRVWKIVVCLC